MRMTDLPDRLSAGGRAPGRAPPARSDRSATRPECSTEAAQRSPPRPSRAAPIQRLRPSSGGGGRAQSMRAPHRLRGRPDRWRPRVARALQELSRACRCACVRGRGVELHLRRYVMRSCVRLYVTEPVRPAGAGSWHTRVSRVMLNDGAWSSMRGGDGTCRVSSLAWGRAAQRSARRRRPRHLVRIPVAQTTDRVSCAAVTPITLMWTRTIPVDLSGGGSMEVPRRALDGSACTLPTSPDSPSPLIVPSAQ